MDCPFCSPTPERVFHGSDPAFICLWDGFAVSPGHALVVPRRHVATWFEASFEEQVALLRGIEIAKKAIESRHQPDGCWRRLNTDPACRLNIDPGPAAAFFVSGCG